MSKELEFMVLLQSLNTVPTKSPEIAEPPLKIDGDADRYNYDSDENSDFVQEGFKTIYYNHQSVKYRLMIVTFSN